MSRAASSGPAFLRQLLVTDCCGLQDGRAVADAALLLPPFYYERAPAAGVRAFIEAALAHAKLPVNRLTYSHAQIHSQLGLIRSECTQT